MTAALIAKLESASEGSRGLDAGVCDALNWRKTDGFWVYPANVTTSIDAALALAERVLPGWDWLLRTDEKRGYMLNCWRRGDEPNLGDDCYPAYAPTPALALCIALLRASAAEGAG